MKQGLKCKAFAAAECFWEIAADSSEALLTVLRYDMMKTTGLFSKRGGGSRHLIVGGLINYP